MTRRVDPALGDYKASIRAEERVRRRELETAKDLLRQVLIGEDILTDRRWMRAAKRLLDET
jgi:hypothetical protein